MLSVGQSADGWESVLNPFIVRCHGKVLRIYFRADAAFATPGVYECVGILAERWPVIGLAGLTRRLNLIRRWSVRATGGSNARMGEAYRLEARL
jgi:hypothetical protein